MNKTLEWIKGHQDDGKEWESIEDLLNLKLSSQATLNIFCNHRAAEAYAYSFSDPEGEILPCKKWALYTTFPVTRKLNGKLDESILKTVYHDNLRDYISHKHNICNAKLDQIDMKSLDRFLWSHPIHRRATIAKLIHHWIPTNTFLHKQHWNELCTTLPPVWQPQRKCWPHPILPIYCSGNIPGHRHLSSLRRLEKSNTTPPILAILERKLTNLLCTANKYKYTTAKHSGQNHSAKIKIGRYANE